MRCLLNFKHQTFPLCESKRRIGPDLTYLLNEEEKYKKPMAKREFATFAWRLIAVHTITYFLAGVAAMYFFNYEELFVSGSLAGFMKPTDSPWVALGPALQVFRGLIFAVALWPFRAVFLNRAYGWQKLWLLFIGLAILSTFGPAPGSVDGLIYTQVPVGLQVRLLPELIIQSLLLSLGLYYWYVAPKKAFNYLSAFLLVLILLMGLAGFFSLNS